jgi:hypothetical protein
MPIGSAAEQGRADRAGLSIGGYFRAAVFEKPPPRQSRRPSADQQLLGRILVALGRIGSNANQLAHQANLGSWPDSRLIAQACADIRTSRDLLFRALGFTPPDDGPAGP